MICVTVQPNHSIVETAFNGAGGCDGLILLSSTEFANISTQITSSEILMDFSWGFGAVLTFWALGFAVSAAKSIIQKI